MLRSVVCSNSNTPVLSESPPASFGCDGNHQGEGGLAQLKLLLHLIFCTQAFMRVRYFLGALVASLLPFSLPGYAWWMHKGSKGIAVSPHPRRGGGSWDMKEALWVEKTTIAWNILDAFFKWKYNQEPLFCWVIKISVEKKQGWIHHVLSNLKFSVERKCIWPLPRNSKHRGLSAIPEASIAFGLLCVTPCEASLGFWMLLLPASADCFQQ